MRKLPFNSCEGTIDIQPAGLCCCFLEVNENCRLAFYYSFQHAREGDLAGLLRCSKGKSQNSCRKAAYNNYSDSYLWNIEADLRDRPPGRVGKSSRTRAGNSH